MKISFCKAAWLSATILLITLNAVAQTTNASAIADDGFMRSEGKIYVVMAVVITILAGLILYVFRLDRKLTKLEKGQSV
jgi:uncharacterized membrane protein